MFPHEVGLEVCFVGAPEMRFENMLEDSLKSLPEAAVSAGMGIGICLVKFIVMLCIFINSLPHKMTFFAGIVFLVLMVQLYVFLDKAVFVGLVRTPCTDTFQILLFQVGWKVLKIFHAVSDVTVATDHMLLLNVFLVTRMIVCLVFTRFTLPKGLLLVDRFDMASQMIFS